MINPDKTIRFDITETGPDTIEGEGDSDALNRLFPVVYAELPGGHHTFDLFHSIRFEAVVDGVEAFSAWVRSGK